MRHSVLLLFFLCSACAFNEEYPDNWSPVIVGTTECPDISGIYKNGGKWASEIEQSNKSDIFLSELFSEQYFEYEAEITIAHPDIDSIQAIIYSAGKSHPSLTLSRSDGDFSCKDGRIWFSESRFSDYGFGTMEGILGMGYGKVRVGFTKSEDGSLVGEALYSEVGVVFIMIPVASSSKDYILWNAVGSNSNS